MKQRGLGRRAILLLLSLMAAVLPNSAMADNNVLYSSDLAPENVCLHGGSTLSGGQYLSNGRYVLVMESDCNLVLYRAGKAIWSSETRGRGSNCVARLRSDANLVIYRGPTKIWSTHITEKPDGDYVLVLQDDGDVAIYGPSVWSANKNVIEGR